MQLINKKVFLTSRLCLAQFNPKIVFRRCLCVSLKRQASLLHSNLLIYLRSVLDFMQPRSPAHLACENAPAETLLCQKSSDFFVEFFTITSLQRHITVAVRFFMSLDYTRLSLFAAILPSHNQHIKAQKLSRGGKKQI
jgi:hypothetical protein